MERKLRLSVLLLLISLALFSSAVGRNNEKLKAARPVEMRAVETNSIVDPAHCRLHFDARVSTQIFAQHSPRLGLPRA